MAYKLFDKDGNIVKYQDLQTKGPWFVKGESSEKLFIDNYGVQLGLAVNPEKRTNKYAIDLINIETNVLGDLKTQNTPFFQAKEEYSIDPQYAVSFNRKDALRYMKFYRDIEIYFWVDWLVTKFVSNVTIEVIPMQGVWKISMTDINTLIKTAPLHYYQQRIWDYSGNNKDSYILDLSDPNFIRVV